MSEKKSKFYDTSNIASKKRKYKITFVERYSGMRNWIKFLEKRKTENRQ